MVVLDLARPFFKVEFVDSSSSQSRSIFSPNVFLDTEKPADTSQISTDVYISHINVNSKMDASINTGELEVRHTIGGQIPVQVGDKVKIYFGFYDQDKSQGPEFSLAFTGNVTKIKNGLEKSIVSCESSMKKIIKKKTKITFSKMMSLKDLINKFAIDIGGLSLSQAGIFDAGINKQPGFGISEQQPLLEYIKRLAKYSRLDIFTDVFDKFHATQWDASKLKNVTNSDTPWLSARGKNEAENCDFYKHKIAFDTNLMETNFELMENKYSGVEVVGIIPFSEKMAHTIDPVKVEYKPANADAKKPLNRYKISHIIREDAEKIAENLYNYDAGELTGSLKLLSAPQIRIGDGIMFDGEGLEQLPFNNIKFDSSGSANKITDRVFQVIEVQHKFDTVEGFVTKIKIADNPAAGSAATGAAESGTGTAVVPGGGIVGTETEFTGAVPRPETEGLVVQVSNASWDKEEARQGDIVTLTADVQGAPDGTQGEIEIFEHDVDGIHDLIKKLPVVVTNNKIKTTWEYEYHEDTDEIPTEEELEKYGRKYNPPEYFFVVKIGDAEDQSGILLYKDYVEIILKSRSGEPIADEEFILTLPDGSEIDGKVDSEGYAKVEGIPPGKVTVRFPKL